MPNVIQAHLTAGVVEAQQAYEKAVATKDAEKIAEADANLAGAQNRFAAWDHHRLGLHSLESAKKTLLKYHGDCEICKAWNGDEPASGTPPVKRSIFQKKA